MSLVEVLTTTRLRSLAGYSYERGARYHKEGRVVSLATFGDRIEGVVAGSEDYAVRVLVHGRTLYTECTCPVGMYCKHAVALALQYLDGGERSAPDATDVGPVFASQGELETWAKQHHVMHALGLSAEVLLPELVRFGNSSELRYVLARLSLRDLGSLEGAARYLRSLRLRRPAAAAVARRLAAAANEIIDGVAEEMADGPTAPTTGVAPADPQLLALWGKLVELRAVVRLTALPRSRAALAGFTLEHVAPTSLGWTESGMVALNLRTAFAQAISARLTFTPAAVLTCTCKAVPCTHGLALIDAALALLADPERAREARRIAAELLRPSWERALAALSVGGAEGSAAAAVTQIEVWWQIENPLRSLTLTPIVKRALKKGGMSAGARISAARLLDDYGAQLADKDLQIAEQLVAFAPVHRGTTYPARAFAALVGHPHVVSEDAPDEPLAIERVPLGFTVFAVDNEIRIEPAIHGARFSPRLLAPLLQLFGPTEPVFVIEPEHRRCLMIDVSEEARRLWRALETHGDTFPPESHAPLLEQLAKLESRVAIAIPQELKGTRHEGEPTVVVRLRLLPDVSLELQAFVRPGPGAPLYPPTAGPRDVMVSVEGVRGYVRRDLGTEHERVQAMLARLPLETAEEGPPLCFRIAEPDAALALVAAVQSPPPGLEAEWIDRTPTVVSASVPSSLRVHVEDRRDWFGLVGELAVEDGRIELALLLDAARRQRRFVRLDEHRWVELSDVLRGKLAAVAEQTFTSRNALELSPGAVDAIKALSAAGAKVVAAAPWQTLTERLEAATKLRPRPPAALVATLRPYQIEGHAWLSRIAAWGAGACLADDMGLGKTVQAIAVLLDRAKLGPALVLAPTSVTLNWVDELRRFAPSLRPVIYGGEADRAACIAGLGKKDILIASYGLLVRDGELLASRSFATLVIDEAQALKNPATRRAKAARGLDAQFRIALSGTPLENHLGELWSLFSVVFPGLLGSWEQFRARFALPIERDRDPEARAALSRVIKPFLLRRTKAEVARELPSRTEIQVPVALSTAETALYEDARLAAVAELTKRVKGKREERQRFAVLAALTRLRLLASHPRLYDAESPVASSKMQRLLELLEELRSEGHRALVFSQFTSHLALVRAEVAKAGFVALYLDGSTLAAARASLIQRFQGGEGDVFLISLKAGGTGINLTAADYVIHLDPWWNPAVEDQATDRAHRIGQTKPVTVYRLISRGTVEEQILEMHGDKRALVAGVLEGTDVAARLTTRDLFALLAPSS